MGEILLKGDQTVESVVHDALRQSFVEKGYRVIENGEQTTNGTYIVDVKINRFWAWLEISPLFPRLNASISTDITIKTPTGETTYPLDIMHFQTPLMVITEKPWVEVMEEILARYIDEVKSLI